MIKDRTPISNQHLVSQIVGNIVSDMDGEKVMLSIQNGKYYNLGEIGGAIWERINEPISVDKLVAGLMDNYDVSQTECEEQVLSFLDKLLEEGLIDARLF
ncbi:lasso peptide biosynthesis PqqD family chaperone [Oceanobacillus sp. 143]|uniref:PqqD family protein n=1 Tax=Oceanobacillus zhaokaii TaxID=2052660 RepID=A0A345PL84_9BACI|nr:lasso peptide biosynthesis PqqD family chaperone [Oceanobacillus zhaokaii]AXI10764.1 PqqD family protein [Oceanobacillus zhaokaii]QGS69679.1 lasso peptide biosynthesis PqqD family chaperone [Oceanobacillus sp. 143]